MLGMLGSDLNSMLQQYQQQQMAELREKNKKTQYDLLDQIKAPTVSDGTKLRLKALEEESKMTPLVEDPLYQAQRAEAVQGGQQALSSVQNTQKAQGTAGGFSNQGSIQDVYDRLSARLSQIGEASRKTKEQKRDTAAEVEQSIADAQTEYENSVTRAKMAIEQGDAQAAAAEIERAMQMREAAEQKKQQMISSLLGAGLSIFGPGAIGGAAKGASAAGASAVGSSLGDYFNGDYTMGGSGSKPWSLMRG